MADSLTNLQEEAESDWKKALDWQKEFRLVG
jgi:hypothetical protein